MFLTFEGGEGVGKSTQVKDVARRLREDFGCDVVVTREPGGTDLGTDIRKILTDRHDKIDQMAELMLFMGDRAQHVSTVILPALKAGKIVLCDRFLHSTLAYQGFGRGIDLEVIQQLHHVAARGLIPDVTFWLNMEPEKAIARLSKRSAVMFDSAELKFHQRVHDGFEYLFHQSLMIREINADQPCSVVTDCIMNRIISELNIQSYSTVSRDP